MKTRLALAAVALCAAVGVSAERQKLPVYEVYAIKFASAPYGVKNLVAGVTDGRSIDLAFTVWVVRGGGKTVLVDAGFYRDKFIQSWKPRDFVKPSDAVSAALGIAPEKITDIIVSHSHWDHADGVDLFPRAKVWIQKEEYEYYVGANGEVLHRGGVDAEDAKMLAVLKAAGRVELRQALEELRQKVSNLDPFRDSPESPGCSRAHAAAKVIDVIDRTFLYCPCASL